MRKWLLFVFIFFGTQPLWAQVKPMEESIELSAGLAVGLNQIPEESEFKSTGLPLVLWGDFGLSDWLRFSFGMLQHSAKLEYSAYNKDWSHRFDITETYLAYRHLSAINNSMDLRSLVGLTQVSVKMSTNQGASETSDQTTGYLLGTGLRYRLGFIDGLEMGLDFLYSSAQGNLAGADLALGSTQLVWGVSYAF